MVIYIEKELEKELDNRIDNRYILLLKYCSAPLQQYLVVSVMHTYCFYNFCVLLIYVMHLRLKFILSTLGVSFIFINQIVFIQLRFDNYK